MNPIISDNYNSSNSSGQEQFFIYETVPRNTPELIGSLSDCENTQSFLRCENATPSLESLNHVAKELTQAIAEGLSHEKCEKRINLHYNKKNHALLWHLYDFIHSVVCDDHYRALLDITDLMKNRIGKELLLSILDKPHFSIYGVDQKISLRELVVNHEMVALERLLPIDDESSEGEIIKIHTSSKRRSQSPQTNKNALFTALPNMGVISTKKEKLEECFEKALQSLIKKPEGRVTIIYTYPLYKTDESLFIFLRTLLPKNGQYVRQFLDDLSKHLFPHGTGQIIAAKESYKGLISDLNIDEPALQMNTLKERVALENIPELFPKELLFTCWSNLSGEAIVKGLTHRDALLFRSTDVASIGKCLKNGIKSIEATSVFFPATLFEIAYQIVSKVDNAKQRETEISKFATIGYSLLMKKNFNGAMQVSAALNHPAVRRLWESNKALYADCQTLIDQCNQDYNEPFNRKVLPYESSIYQSLQKTYVDMKDEKIKFTTGLQDLAQKIRLLKNGRLMCSNLGIQSKKLHVVQFLSNFKRITEEALIEYSFLCHDQERFYTNNLPKKLYEWNATDLAQFISQLGDRNAIKTLLDQGIFTGNILIDELDNNKHFMDEWPYDLRVSFAALYAKHMILSFSRQ
jgi:hypothetical protein